MTTEEALNQLRDLNDSDLHVLALVPNRRSFLGGDGLCWTIYDINVANDKWVEIATGDTCVEAVRAAQEKLIPNAEATQQVRATS
jgi:hypothetical protein